MPTSARNTQCKRDDVGIVSYEEIFTFIIIVV